MFVPAIVCELLPALPIAANQDRTVCYPCCHANHMQPVPYNERIDDTKSHPQLPESLDDNYTVELRTGQFWSYGPTARYTHRIRDRMNHFGCMALASTVLPSKPYLLPQR